MPRRILTTLLATCAFGLAAAPVRAQYIGVVNVAKGAPVSAATPVYLGGPPSVVTDGKSGTFWYSGSLQEYTIDLGRELTVGKILVYAGQAGNIVISSSVDGFMFEPRHAIDFADALHSNWLGSPASAPLSFWPNGAYSARYLKYRSAMSPGCGCYQGTYEFSVFEWMNTPPPELIGDNLVTQPGVTIADLYGSNPSFPAGNAIDGEYGTSWIGSYWGRFTAFAGQQFYSTWGIAEIDLGAERTVFGARVHRPATGGAQTVLLSFYDGAHTEVEWFGQADDTVIGTASPAFGEASGVFAAPVLARYVRIRMGLPLTPNLTEWPAITEVEVYGEIESPGSDTTPPVLSGMPADIIAEASGPNGVAVEWPAPSASDDVDGEVTVVCAPASGTVFGIGTTLVTCTAPDEAGNVATGSFAVTVADTTPPTVTVPANITTGATGPGGAVVNYTVGASDNIDGPLTPLCQPASGSTFLVGTTTVTCTAMDASFNGASGSFTVTVTPQNDPPVCTASAPTVPVIWPPNHSLVTIGVTGVTDANQDRLTIRISGIFQDEPTNTAGDGNTGIDGFGVGAGLAQVRAERSGLGNGRVYHVRFEATDEKGAGCAGEVRVAVPHQPGKPAIDGGLLYDSTGGS